MKGGKFVQLKVFCISVYLYHWTLGRVTRYSTFLLWITLQEEIDFHQSSIYLAKFIGTDNFVIVKTLKLITGL